ncbi:MAG: hypothetical protein K0A90_00120 [Methanosarcinaceae archaeon]|nr:hypothetical protein [Methanosarcinaceae archaeon]
MAEMIWKIGLDSGEALKAGKAFSRGSKGKDDKVKSGGGAFSGGLIGSLLGSLLSSVKMLFDPLSAIASLLIMALFPILKPFLILFIKVGLLLYKFLNKMLGGSESVKGTAGRDETGKIDVSPFGVFVSLISGLALAILLIIGVFLAFPTLLAGAGTATIIGLVAVLGLVLAYLSQEFMKFVVWFSESLNKFIIFLIEKWVNFTNRLGAVLVDVVNFLGAIWNGFLDMLTKSWEGLKSLGTWIYDSITSILETSWEGLKSLGTWIYDTFKSIFISSMSVLSNIGNWISDKIKSLIGFGGGGGSSKVNDAIITPNGDIIRTNPADYIIATKNPGALGGGSGGPANITVTINGGLITDDVARDIGKVILREVNMGGGF